MNRTPLLILTALSLIGLPVGATAAGVQIDLDFGTGLVFPGNTLTFTGTISNLDLSTVFLNSCQVNLTGISVTEDCSDFLLNAPTTLDPLQTGIPSFGMFTITANSPYLDSLGVQNGSFD